MKKTILIAMVLLARLAVAQPTPYYDAINNAELMFSAARGYEELTIDELNPLDEVGYSFFVFENEDYEARRKEKVHDKFKIRPLEASFKLRADLLAQMYFNDFYTAYNQYRDLEYQGFVIDDMDLRPISYLGNTLTFSFTVNIIIKGLEDDPFTIEEIYYLNLDDFSILPASAIHQSIDYKSLRLALTDKWREIRSEMPARNWVPIEAEAGDEDAEYEDRYAYHEREFNRETETYFHDSLISFAIEHADLTKSEITYTGAGVLVVLNDPFPWFQYKFETPLVVQLHLEPHEAKDALRAFEPYQALQNATEPDPGKLPVDPYDLFQEARYLNLNYLHIDFLRLEDTSIHAIEKYLGNSAADSQYVHQLNYKDGRLFRIDKPSGSEIAAYDSIIWQNDRVNAVFSREEERSRESESGYEINRSLQIQSYDEYGNTKWHLSTEHSIYIEQYTYFKEKVALYSYALISAVGGQNHYEQRPYWYHRVKDGICLKDGRCAKVDQDKRPSVKFGEFYAYNNDQLVQIMGERERSKLFYYDENNRLSSVISTYDRSESFKYSYEGVELLPYRIENTREQQTRSQNFYLIIHR